MKKTLLFLITVFAVNFSFAQIKVKAGTNFSKFTGESTVLMNTGLSYTKNYSEETNFKIGINISAGYQINLNNKFSLTPELQFNQFGAKDKEYLNNRKITTSQSIISIPIMIEYNLLNKLKVGLGPQLNYLLKSKYKVDHINIINNENNTLNNGDDDTDHYNKISIGLTGGISYNIYKNFSLEARYYHGISNISNTENTPKFSNATYTTKMHNTALQFGISYIIK